MTDFATLSATLIKSLDLQQPPIAISFTDSLPSDTPAYEGTVPAGCRFWQEASTHAFATTSVDHEMCAIGVYTHKLQGSHSQQTDLMDALKVFGDLGYVRPEDIPQIPVLHSTSKYVVYAPLAKAPLPPEVVLLFVSANQTLILSEATQQVESQSSPAMGRPACAVVPQVVNTGKAALSLGCCGARAYLDTFTDSVAIFAIPGAKLEAYVARIEVLANANKTLSQFHQIRRHSISAGNRPSIKESLEAFAEAQV